MSRTATVMSLRASTPKRWLRTGAAVVAARPVRKRRRLGRFVDNHRCPRHATACNHLRHGWLFRPSHESGSLDRVGQDSVQRRHDRRRCETRRDLRYHRWDRCDVPSPHRAVAFAATREPGARPPALVAQFSSDLPATDPMVSALGTQRRVTAVAVARGEAADHPIQQMSVSVSHATAARPSGLAQSPMSSDIEGSPTERERK
jgi:hypothetical protein